MDNMRINSSSKVLGKGEGTTSSPFKIEADVNIQDQHSPPFDLLFTQAKGAPTTLSSGVAVNDKTIEVASAANITVGTYLGVFSGDSDEGRYYWGDVLEVSETTITLDSPMDYEYQVGDTVLPTITNMAVNGSVTPQVFAIQAGDSGIYLDITRIMLSMVCDTQPLLSKFGDITALTHGLVFRYRDHVYRNLFNWKTNYDIGVYSYDLSVYDATHPVNDLFGLNCRFTYAGQDKHGVVIRIGPGEAAEFVIQDDLSDLVHLQAIAEGHLVVD